MRRESFSAHPEVKAYTELPQQEVVEPYPEPTGEKLGHNADIEVLGSLTINEILRQEDIDPKAASVLTEKRHAAIIESLDAAEQYAQYAPIVASAIVQQYEPTTETAYPTAAEIREQSFGAQLVSSFLGFFSDEWADRFDRYLERKARQKILNVAQSAVRKVEVVGDIAKPKVQFVSEVSSMQQDIRSGSSVYEQLSRITEHASLSNEDDGDTPLLGRLVGQTKLPAWLWRRRTLRAFAPEIILGIEQFLRGQGVEIESSQQNEPESFMRRATKRFAPRVISGIPQRVETTLNNVYRVLPEDGIRFRNSFRALAKKVSDAENNGREQALDLLEEMREIVG